MKVDSSLCLRRAQHIIEARGDGLPRLALTKGLLPATQFRSERADDGEIPLGASRFGGRPDLPSSTAWPRWDGFFEPDQVLDQKTTASLRKVFEALGQPAPVGEVRVPRGCKPASLSFLAQINLAETADGTGLLPETGWLCFFYDARQKPAGYDPRHRGGARVLYFDGEAQSIRRTEPPPGTEEFAARLVRPQLVATLPRWPNQLGIELLKPEWEVYKAIVEELTGKQPHHRLLGWDAQIQGDMDRECQLVTNGIYCGSADGYRSAEAERLEAGVKDWIMLLQLDTDDDGPGWTWHDGGRVYYWIRKQDLAERRFDRIWAILQCY
jgi:uncharacterized protein YwqG